MSTYVFMGCKTCLTDCEEFAHNHAEGLVEDVLVNLPHILTFLEAVRPSNSSLVVTQDIWGGCFVDFAVEHAGHDLYIVDEYGHWGKTVAEYNTHYSAPRGTFPRWGEEVAT